MKKYDGHMLVNESVQEIKQLIEKQQMLEKELNLLKNSLLNVQQTNEEAIIEVHSRIDSVEQEIALMSISIDNLKKEIAQMNISIDNVEKEMAQMSISIDNVVTSVDRVQSTVNNVYKAVGKIEGKQDKTIEVQENFISQLWKAFFAILTVVTAGAGIIFALINK